MKKKAFLIIGSIVIVAGAALVGAYLLYKPGPICWLQVEELDIDDDAMGTLISSMTLSPRCTLYTSKSIGEDGYKVITYSNKKLLPLRHQIKTKFAFALDPELEIDGGVDLAVRKDQAIKVVRGKTYEITPDKPLVLYSFTTSNGNVYEARFEVSSGPPDVDQFDSLLQATEKELQLQSKYSHNRKPKP
jgi:hypothetical protein